ncbi:Vgb family protein [Actinosynnema sp. NPDC004786]
MIRRSARSVPAVAVGVLLAACSVAPAPFAPPGPVTGSIGSTGSASASRPGGEVRAVRLPEGAFPRYPAVGPDGAVWCTESSGEAMARVGADGTVTHVRLPGGTGGPDGVVRGPDGLMWYTAHQVVGRITTDLRPSGWSGGPLGYPAAPTAGPDGAIWFTNETNPPAISRISAAGALTHHRFDPGGENPYLSGIAAGPDGALWFTENFMIVDGPHGIGRMTTDGEYRRWVLPATSANPRRIVAGPDGALWFTTARGLGRITVDGAITEFPTPPGAEPFDLTAGADGALWFTTDERSIGRLTTSGEMTLHPIEGAEQLIGITAARDGTLWIADGEADTLWRYTPAR